MKAKKVLIVEDERPMSKALKIKLEHEGLTVDVADDGAEGLVRLREGGYDLVVLDLIMPNVDGFTVLETMRSEGLKTPVVVASNLSKEGDSDRVKSLGAIDYFIKSNTSLSEIVQNIIKHLH